MVDHSREGQGAHVVFIAFAVESFAEIVGLVPRPKLNCHRPARPVDFHELGRRALLAGEIAP